MANEKWPEWWRYVRDCVDLSPNGEVTFTVGEIIAGGRSFDNAVRTRPWWRALMNPANDSYKGLIENGLTCELHPEAGPIIDRVTFRVVVG